MSNRSYYIISILAILILLWLQADQLSAATEINNMALAVLRLSRGRDILASTCEPARATEDSEQSGIDDLIAHLQSYEQDDTSHSTRVPNLLQSAMQLKPSLYKQEIQAIAPSAGQFGAFRLVLARFMSGDLDGAARILDTLGAARYPLNAGNVCRGLGMDDAAAQWYQLAAKLDSVSGRALLELGLIEYSKGIFDVAEERFVEALNQGYRTAEVYEYLGAAMAQTGRYDDAAIVLRHGLESSPESVGMWLLYAECLFHVGQVDESILANQQVLVLSPNNTYGHLGLARAYLRNEDTSAALAEIKTVLHLMEKFSLTDTCKSLLSMAPMVSDAGVHLRITSQCGALGSH